MKLSINQGLINFFKHVGFNPQRNFKVNNMLIEIKKHGGLIFRVKKYEEGWLAECATIKGIIASNTNSNPTRAEVDNYIKGAIFSAFDIPFYLCDSSLIRSPLEKVQSAEKAIEEQMIYG